MTERESIAWERFNGLALNGIELIVAKYDNGRPALQAFEKGEPFATVTVNLVDRQPGEGEFYVKCSLAEYGGASLLHSIVEAGLAYPTGKTVAEGFSERYAEVWKVTL